MGIRIVIKISGIRFFPDTFEFIHGYHECNFLFVEAFLMVYGTVLETAQNWLKMSKVFQLILFDVPQVSIFEHWSEINNSVLKSQVWKITVLSIRQHGPVINRFRLVLKHWAVEWGNLKRHD